MKRYCINDMQILVTGRDYYIGKREDDFDLCEYEQSYWFETEDKEKFIMSESHVIKLPDNFPIEWMSNPFIFKCLADILESASSERLIGEITGLYGINPYDDIARVKKVLKDVKYMANRPWAQPSLPVMYDDYDAITTEIGGFVIHHTRHNRRFDCYYEPVFIYGKNIYISASDKNSNGCIYANSDHEIFLCPYGGSEFLIGTY